MATAAAVLAAAACTPTSMQRPKIEPSLGSPSSALPPKVTPAKVVRIVDGDTARMVVDGIEERVRFIGIDTPEKGRPYFDDATRYAHDSMANKTVWLELDVDPRDRYGRLLAYVWLSEPRSAAEQEVRTEMFNARALLDGFAALATFPPNVHYVDMFTGFQKEAREQKRGLWSDS